MMFGTFVLQVVCDNQLHDMGQSDRAVFTAMNWEDARVDAAGAGWRVWPASEFACCPACKVDLSEIKRQHGWDPTKGDTAK